MRNKIDRCVYLDENKCRILRAEKCNGVDVAPCMAYADSCTFFADRRKWEILKDGEDHYKIVRRAK